MGEDFASWPRCLYESGPKIACCVTFLESGGSRGLFFGPCRRETSGQLLTATVTGSGEGDIALLGKNQNSAKELLEVSKNPCPRSRPLTLASRLDGDLLAAVPPACRGDRGHPQQVLLSPVQVGNPVEELFWTRLVLAGSLWGGGKATV